MEENIDLKIISTKIIIKSSKNYLWYLRFKKYPFLKYMFPLTCLYSNKLKDVNLRLIKGDVELLQLLRN